MKESFPVDMNRQLKSSKKEWIAHLITEILFLVLCILVIISAVR